MLDGHSICAVAGPRTPKAFGHARTAVKKLSGGNLPEPSLGHFVKSLVHRSQACHLAGVVFPAPDRYVDIRRIKLDRPGTATGLFGRDQDRSTATKGVEHQTAALRTILDRVGNE